MPDLTQPDLITSDANWPALRAGIRSAISAYVRALHPHPGLYAPQHDDPTEHRARYLLTLATERAVADHLDQLTIAAGQWAVHYGATPAELAEMDGTTPERAAERYAIPDHYRDRPNLPQRPEWATNDDDSNDASAGRAQQ